MAKQTKTKKSQRKAAKKSDVATKRRAPKKSAKQVQGPPMGLDNVLFRPDRLQYVRGQADQKIAADEQSARSPSQGQHPGQSGQGKDATERNAKPCVFCQALTTDPALVLASTPLAFAVLNKYPYNNGHLLVLPRRHVGDLVALTPEEIEHTQALLRFAIEVQRETSSVQGFNVGLNLGAAAGAGLPDHLHWHLVPRWSGDLNFFPLIARNKVVVETLETSKKRIGPRLQAKVNAWLQTQIVAD